MGTIRYMSPEQAAADHGKVGPPSDVYSLGAILYEMLTGRLVVEEPDLMLALEQIKNREPVRPRDHNPVVPPPLELICLKCLEKEPQDRYHPAAELADELNRFLKGEQIKTPSPGLGGAISDGHAGNRP